MRLADLRLLASLVLLACAGPRKGEPWVFELSGDDPGVGRQRVELFLEVDPADGAVRGGSRRGALSAISGSFWVRAYEWFHPRGGSLVEVTGSSAAREGEALRLVLDAPTGELVLDAVYSADGFEGRWSGPGLGAWRGAFSAAPRVGETPEEPLEEPLDDYPAILEAFLSELEDDFVFPARLAESRDALDAARARAGDVVDDFEFVGLALYALEQLSTSTGMLRAAAKPAETRVDVTWHDDVCVLSFGGIFRGLAAIDAAFEEADDARALVVDLRGSVGYDLTPGRILGYLAEEEAPIGYMLGRKRADDGPLDAEARDGLPVITGLYSFALYRRALGLAGVAAGGVAPLDEAFDGPVCVLIDRFTRAGNEPVIEYLARSGRATLVGEPTAGASVDVELVELEGSDGEPLGWTALIPMGTWVTWEGRWMEREPVRPAVRCASAEALDVALELLREEIPEDSL